MISILGAGPGSLKCMTGEVLDRIASVEYLLAFDRIAETVRSLRDDVIVIEKLSELLPLPDGDVAILASGDALYYGVADFLMRSGIEIDEVLPGITSFQYMMSRLKLPWNGANLMSLHNRSENLNKVLFSKISVILTDGENTPTSISKRMFAEGVRGKLYVGYELSYPEERIIEGRVGNSFADESTLAVVVIINEMV